ncbi:MAG: MBL fold metallo-hydrolase [Bacteroidota bacterium]
MKIKEFVFNPFQENTYVVYDETKECIIIDPGCYDVTEFEELRNFISSAELKPVALLNTHCHIDHVFGNYFVADEYGLKPQIHPNEKQILLSMSAVGEMYGLNVTESPEAEMSLADNANFRFGNTELKMIFAPGHSPGSICFYHDVSGQLIGGDVLFQGSIGRSDLPGGDFHTLLQSIRERLFILPDETVVYPGHGPQTTIGYEKKFNPFLTDAASYTS